VDARRWFHGHELRLGARFRISTALLDGAPAWLERQMVDDPDRSSGLALTLDRNDGRPMRMPFTLPISSDGFVGTGDADRILSFGESLQPPVVFRTTRRLTTSEFIPTWSRVVLTEVEDDVVAALRLLEPRIQRLAIIGANGDSSAQLRLKGEEQPVPLGSMGEGMTRMLSLALALASARGGYLFADEIETGLHYSAHRSMWSLVLEMAKRLNVQVFATTHSKDCLEAIADLHRSAPDATAQLTVHRLEAERSSAVRMTADVIEGTLDGGVEIR